jgi:hypothetical protein
MTEARQSAGKPLVVRPVPAVKFVREVCLARADRPPDRQLRAARTRRSRSSYAPLADRPRLEGRRTVLSCNYGDTHTDGGTGDRRRATDSNVSSCAHRDGRRSDGQRSLSGHCGHGPIFIAQRSVANDPSRSPTVHCTIRGEGQSSSVAPTIAHRAKSRRLDVRLTNGPRVFVIFFADGSTKICPALSHRVEGSGRLAFLRSPEPATHAANQPASCKIVSLGDLAGATIPYHFHVNVP